MTSRLIMLIQGLGLHLPALATVLVASIVSGCVNPAFEQRASDYNISMAKTAQEQVVLNILRAAYRKPLYFSTISSVDSREIGDFGLDVDVPIGPGAKGAELLSGIGLNDSTPRFTVSALMNASFMRSMLRPVELGLFERISSRNYDTELVMRLFVREIGWMSEPLVNNADTFEKSAFRRRLRLLAALGLSTEPLLGDNTLIEDLDQDDTLELIDSIRAISTPRLSIVPDRVTGKFDIVGEPGGFRLCFRRPPVFDVDNLSDKQLARAVDLTCRIWVVSQLTTAELGGRDLKRLTRDEKVKLLRSVDDQVERNASQLAALDAEERRGDDTADLEELVAALLSQSESGSEDGVGEQELGRLENFGGLAITIRSPIEMFDFLGEIHRQRLVDESATFTILPNRRYHPENRCTNSRNQRCAALQFFRLVKASTPDSQLNAEIQEYDYTVPGFFDQPMNRTTDTLGVLSDLTSIFIDSDDIEASSRVTVLP